MMEKNNQKAIGFIFLLFITMTYKELVWDPYFIANQHAVQQAATGAATGAGTQQTQQNPLPVLTNAPAQTLVPPSQSVAQQSVPNAFPTDEQIQAAGVLTLENEALLIKISLLGGRVTEYRLKKYAETLTPGSLKLNLIDHSQGQPLPLGVYSGAAGDAWVTYQNVSTNPADIRLAGILPDGRQIAKQIQLTPKSYLLKVDIGVSAPPVDGAPLVLEWSRYLPKDSSSFLDATDTGGFVSFDGQRAARVSFNHMETAAQALGGVIWTSMTDHYFVVSVISPHAPAPAQLLHDGELFRMQMAGNGTTGSFEILGGPKSYDVLRETGYALERNIDFGWTGFLAAPLLLLLNMFNSFLHNYGLAIIALTIVVRVLLLPLNAASFKSMQKMADLQPEVKRIRETIKDKRQQQLAQHELFQKRGVNPLGGCLPILIQIPIFFGLYSALLLAIELRHAPFAAWIQDLSAPEGIRVGDILLPILVIFFVITMLYQQWSTPSTMDETQKKIMLLMPIIFGFVFFRQMPAGLILYWVTSNVISIVQMRQLRKEGSHSPFLITTAVAGLCFAFAFLLTKIA